MKYSKETSLYVEREKPFIKRDTFSNVVQVGYVTVEQQVMSMLINGERLMSYKRMVYDYPDGEFDPDFVKPDPTLSPDFDMADASYYQSQLALKLKAQKFAASKLEKGVNEGKDSSVPSAGDSSDTK